MLCEREVGRGEAGYLPAVPISPISTRSKNTGLRKMTISIGC